MAKKSVKPLALLSLTEDDNNFEFLSDIIKQAIFNNVHFYEVNLKANYSILQP
jgi:hypothetical protein